MMRDVQCSFINDLVPNKLDNWNNEYKRRYKFIQLLKFKYERKAFNNLTLDTHTIVRVTFIWYQHLFISSFCQSSNSCTRYVHMHVPYLQAVS